MNDFQENLNAIESKILNLDNNTNKEIRELRESINVLTNRINVIEENKLSKKVSKFLEKMSKKMKNIQNLILGKVSKK